MIPQNHKWLLPILDDLGAYLELEGLPEAHADLEVLRATVKRTLASNVYRIEDYRLMRLMDHGPTNAWKGEISDQDPA